MSDPAMIEIENLRKSFRGECVLDGISLQVSEKDTVVCVGPSGCGKTTLVRILAGITDADRGDFQLGGSFSMVFQEPRLMPWRTVWENIKLPEDLGREQISEDRIQSLIEAVNLESYKESYPHQLSGGMKQRVALVRALSLDPDVILFDEPLSSLDYRVRKSIREDIRKLLDSRDITSLYVTHNLEDALELADSIAVLTNSPTTIAEVADVSQLDGVEHLKRRLDSIYDDLD